MNVYKGEQSFIDFLAMQAQGNLFYHPSANSEDIKRKLGSFAARVVNDLGHEASWADLKDTLKSRAAGKVLYNSDVAVKALENALRMRGQAVK